MVIREATLKDCEGLMKVLNNCILEGDSSTALTAPVQSVKEEEEFFRSLGERERIVVAEEQESKVVGFSVLYTYNKIGSMSHVGGVGTFVDPSARRRGVGTLLNHALVILARELGYEKLVAEIRKENSTGLKFYESCGFLRIAELRNQVKLSDRYDSIVLTEKFI